MTKKHNLNDTSKLEVFISGIKKEQQLVQDTHLINSPNKAQKDTQLSDDKLVLIEVCVDALQSGKYQPRRKMNQASLAELADSILQHGIMQPIVIRPLLKNNQLDNKITHEIIAGERRWRAAKMAGLTKIPAIQRILSDEVTMALALIENIQREDLNILEQAQALQRFHTEFGMSHAMIAEVVGKARATVTNLLRLNQLNEEVKKMLADDLLDMGHARALLPLADKQQPMIAKKIIQQKMTVREAEKLVKSILDPQTIKPNPTHQNSQKIALLNQKLSDHFGSLVKVKQNTQGEGSMEIFFYSDDEFYELLKQMNVLL